MPARAATPRRARRSRFRRRRWSSSAGRRPARTPSFPRRSRLRDRSFDPAGGSKAALPPPHPTPKLSLTLSWSLIAESSWRSSLTRRLEEGNRTPRRKDAKGNQKGDVEIREEGKLNQKMELPFLISPSPQSPYHPCIGIFLFVLSPF